MAKSVVLSVALTASVLGLASAAEAGDGAAPPLALAGTYVTASIGGPLTTKQEFDDTVFGKGSYEPDWGLGGALEIGRHIGPEWRVGISGGFARGFDGELKLTDLGLKNKLNGHSDAYTLMVHAYRTLGRLDTFLGEIHPFVGAGAGIVYYDVKEFGNGGPGDKTDTAFAAALHIGYDRPLRPGITLTSRYSLGYTGEAQFGQALNGTTTKQDELDFFAYTGIRFDLD